jgi:hypothetical protein
MAFLPVTARAHFTLESPDAMFVQDAVGNPLLDAPCGDDGAAVPTGAVTSYASGETIQITIDETITHPGHYRVALALNDPSELPPPPPVTPGTTECGSVPIQDPPVFPILADGALLHSAAFAGPQSFAVALPDVTCEHCTLQVMEFLSSHSAPCFHYHCAALRIPEPSADGVGIALALALGALRVSRRL